VCQRAYQHKPCVWPPRCNPAYIAVENNLGKRLLLDALAQHHARAEGDGAVLVPRGEGMAFNREGFARIGEKALTRVQHGGSLCARGARNPPVLTRSRAA
jgi:hypothetical protein